MGRRVVLGSRDTVIVGAVEEIYVYFSVLLENYQSTIP